MPRPPARRARTAANKASSNVSGKETGVCKDGSVTTPGQAADLQSAQAAPAHDDGGHRTDLTPTKDSHEIAIASSPAGNTTTASVRPPTRARGYSSTLSLVGRKGDFNSRVGSTPGFESSILSNFKKRSRQPSLLQMMQADDDEDSSDYDDDDFLGGFSPQDESTPLNVARKSIVTERELIASPSRAGPAHISPPSSTESRKRKRQSVDVADEQQEQQDAHRVVSPDLRSRSSSLSTLTPAPESPAASQRSLLSPSSTLATPMSTSTATTPSRLMAGQHMVATTLNRVAPIETLPKVTTLSIQTRFLPQRRIRRRQRMASEEVDSNNSADEDQDEDELTREVMRRPQRVRRQGLSNATSEKTNAKPTKNASRRGAQKKSSKVSTTIHETVESRGSRSRRTYSRQQAQTQAQPEAEAEALDKENHEIVDSSDLSSPPPSEDLEDSDLEMTSRPHGSKTRISSRELQDAARKFAEVDKWEMEFEDVSHSESSPMR